MNGKGIHITSRVMGGILLILCAGAIALRSDAVQRRLARAVESKVESIFESADVSLSSIRITTYGAIVLKDLAIIDPTPYRKDKFSTGYTPVDTILFAKTISATLTLKGLFRKEGVHIGRLNVENGGFYLVSEPVEDSGRSTNFEALFPSQPIDSDYVAQPGPNLFDIRRVNISDFRFRLVNFSSEESIYKGWGINFEDMDLSANARAHSLKMAGGKMYGVLDHLDAVEKSGYRLTEVTGRTEVGLGKALITDAHIVDDCSDIRLKSFSMSFRNTLDFSDYVNKVVMDGEFARSKVAMASINWYSGNALRDNDLVADIYEGHVHGTTNDILATGIKFTELHSGISTTATCRVSNVVPNVDDMFLEGTVTGLKADSRQLSLFLTEWARRNGKSVDLSKLVPGLTLTADASCRGNINRLGVAATIHNGELGTLKYDGIVRNTITEGKPIIVDCHIVSGDLNSGLIAKTDKLNLLAAEGAFSIIVNENNDIKLDSLQIHSLEAIGYELHDIAIQGDMTDNTVSLKVNSADPALKTNLIGLIDLKPFDGCRRYRLAGNIDNIDFHALNFDKRGEISSLSANVYANFVKDSLFTLGDAFIDSIKIVSDNGIHDIGNVNVRAHARDGMQHFRLNSPFADATYEGSGTVKDLLDEIQDLTLRTHLPAIQGIAAGEPQENHYEMDVNIHDSRTLLTYLMPKLYIADSTNVNLSINNGVLQAGIQSDRIAMGTTFARKLAIDIDNLDNSLNAFLTSSQFILGGMEVTEPAFAAYADSNNVDATFQFDNFNGSNSKGEIFLDGEILRDEADSLVIKARPVNSHLRAGKDLWEFGASEIMMRGKDISIDSLSIHNGLQEIFLDGSLSSVNKGSLSLALNALDLSGLSQFLPNKYRLDGVADGRIVINSPTKSQLGLFVNLNADDLAFGDSEIGNLKITSSWKDGSDEIECRILNDLQGRSTLRADGTINAKDKSIAARAAFDDFPLEAATPFLSQIFTSMGGSIKGGVRIYGKPDDLHLSGRGVHLNDALIQVGVTNVTYLLDGPIDINEDGIFLNGMSVRDRSGGSASLNGSLRHKNFKDISLDAALQINNLEMISVPEEGNNGFYGNLRANGSIGLSGPVSNIIVDADVATSGNGDIHVPLSGGLNSNVSNLLTFTEHEIVLDPYEQMLLEYQESKEHKTTSDFIARGRLRITDGLKAFLEIDKSAGHIMSVNGAGTIGLEIRPKKDIFNLNGDYIINSGNYHFVLPGLLEKDFNINEGSYLRLGGNLMESEINIDAVHPVKTSLNTLVSGEDIGNTRRLVNCGLNISNNLKSPKITFSVDVPDLSPQVKSRIDGALNTEDKVQKQFAALLLMGTFIPDQAGIVNGYNMLYSNVSEIMSSQINNVLAKLNIPVDIGVGYQQTDAGTNMFDVAVSTQLFNNRVVVNGSVGNRKDKNGTSYSNGDIVGDIDVELKLDKAGRFRLNAFSHSADDYTNFLDQLQRNGIGVSYQKEFNTAGEFFKTLFVPQRKQPQEELTPQDNVIIRIENEQQAIPDSLSVGR